jgi:hypothetical protein
VKLARNNSGDLVSWSENPENDQEKQNRHQREKAERDDHPEEASPKRNTGIDQPLLPSRLGQLIAGNQEDPDGCKFYTQLF